MQKIVLRVGRNLKIGIPWTAKCQPQSYCTHLIPVMRYCSPPEKREGPPKAHPPKDHLQIPSIVETCGEKQTMFLLHDPTKLSSLNLNQNLSLMHKLQQLVKKFFYYFLPKGYPGSVSPDYIYFYGWMFFVNFFGSASYVISTTALLESVNIVSNASGIAAGITWVLKDGLGTLGKIASTNILAKKFDSDSKRAMWRGEILHNIGVGLELATAVFPMLFLYMASLANICKGVAGITIGACKASINQHFANNENYNLGDITAKSTTQGLAGFALGMSFGIWIYQIVSAYSYYWLWVSFFGIGCCHIFCSYQALRNVQFRTLNQQRFAILLEQFLKKEEVDTPEMLKNTQKEYIVLKPPFMRDPRIYMGGSLSSAFSSPQELLEAYSLFQEEPYILHYHNNSIHVLVKEGIDTKNLLKAFFSAYYLQDLLRKGGPSCGYKEGIEMARGFSQENFPALLGQLEKRGWDLSVIALEVGDHRLQPPSPNTN